MSSCSAWTSINSPASPRRNPERNLSPEIPAARFLIGFQIPSVVNSPHGLILTVA
jgi:hypothetical protein